MPYKDPDKQRAHAREWFHRNKDKKREYDKKRASWYLPFLKRQCFLAYGGIFCACPSGLCSENNIDFLTLDHINGGGSQHRRTEAKGNIYQFLKARGYPSGYRVLCYNCNCAMGHNKGICPHEKG